MELIPHKVPEPEWNVVVICMDVGSMAMVKRCVNDQGIRILSHRSLIIYI